MKLNYAALSACLLVVLNQQTEGFSVSSAYSQRIQVGKRPIQRNGRVYRMSDSSVEDEVTKLKEAAAQARAEAARLAKELGKDVEEDPAVNAKTDFPAKSSKSNEEIRKSLLSIDFEGSDAVSQTMQLDALRDEGCISLYKSCTAQSGSGDLKDFPVSLSMLESRSGLTAKALGIGVEEVSLDDFKYATLYVVGGCSVAGVASLAFLPENIGPTICYLLAVIPILFLGIGSTAPGFIAEAIARLKGDDGESVSKATRVGRHEAAHFLCGYLCGLPIAGYSTTEENIPCIEFHTTRSGPLTAKQELSDDEVNALTVVALSGSVAEAMSFGNAKGSTADLMELEANVFRQSKNFLGAAKQQDLTRWGALTAHRLLTLHKSKLDALVEAFAAQKSVAECVAVIEQN